MKRFCYPAKFEPNGEGGFIGTFRDVPEAITEVYPEENFVDIARDALISAIDFYIEDGRKLPEPSQALEDEVLVDLPASVVLKVLLLNTMVESNMRPVDLARKMKIRPQEVTRILNIRHNTKLDTLSNAFTALGKELYFDIK